VSGDFGSAGQPPADLTRNRHRAADQVWARFVDWRRSRPFWGGLLLVTSGIEFYVSGHLDLMPVKVSFGPQSFLSWLIPLALLLCGLLVWFTPAQRIFYGILGAVIAVAALIGLNLGGFFVGMLLGVAGGALAFSWAPDEPPADQPEPELPDDTEPQALYEPETLDELLDRTDPAEAGMAESAVGALPPDGVGVRPYVGPAEEPARRSDRFEPDLPDRHERAGPDGTPSGPASRLPYFLLIILAVTATLVALPARPAAAAPCPPVVTPSTAPSTTPSSTPKAPDPITGFFQRLGRLLGIGGPAPTPTPTPSGSPSPSATDCPAPPTGTPRPGPTKRVRTLAPQPGQPLVNAVPSTQITARLSQTGLSYDGIVDLPTHTGTLRALQFSLRSSTSTPFELQVPVPGVGTLSLRSSKLTVSGQVRFYTTQIKGKLFGLLPVTFTPESPPPLVVPDLFFTDATVQLAFVHCDRLTAPTLRINYL
jgi:Family of unknown function (DUF6114)